MKDKKENVSSKYIVIETYKPNDGTAPKFKDLLETYLDDLKRSIKTQ